MMIKKIFSIFSVSVISVFLFLPLVNAEYQQNSSVSKSSYNSEYESFLNETRKIKNELKWNNKETKEEIMELLYRIPPKAKIKAISALKNELKKNGYLKNDEAKNTEIKKITKQDFMKIMKLIIPFEQEQEIDKYFQAVSDSKKISLPSEK